MALDSLLGPPTSDGEAGYAERAAIVRAHLLTMAGAAVIVAALPVVSGGFERRLTIAALLLLAALVAAIPLRFGRPRLAATVCVVNFAALLFGVALFAGGVHAPAFSALLLLSTVAAVLLSWRAAIVASVVGVVGGLALLVLEQSGRLPAVTVVHSPETIFGANALFLALITVPLVVAVRGAARARARLDIELAERRAAEERSREHAAHLKAVLENVGGYLGLLTTDGRVVMTNLRSRGATRYRPEDLIGRLAWEMSWLDGHPEMAAWARDAVTRAASGESSLRAYTSLGPDGVPRFYEIGFRPARDDAGQIVYIVAQTLDVSERESLSRVKDQFLAVAAHELKTPVTIMKGYAQALLRADDGQDVPRRRLLSAIDRGADRIDRVVRDLLDVSRLQAGQLQLDVEPLSLADVVAEVADRLALTAPRHRLAVDSADGQNVIVNVDRYRIEQALAGIIDNAIRYSPGGGEVRIGIAQADAEAVISVRDQGIGIPSDRQEGMFERFYRAHSGTPYDYGGMGVGLYIAREIVVRHGGRMWFQSIEGAGSTFYIALPLQFAPG